MNDYNKKKQFKERDRTLKKFTNFLKKPKKLVNLYQ